MVTKKHHSKKEDFMQSQWRPLLARMYLAVCSFDVILAPVLWSVLQAIDKGNVSSQWMPITLQGAGLFHLAMGAVLGVAAYGRTQEKINGSASNQSSTPYTPSSSTPYTPTTSTSTPWTGSSSTSTPYTPPAPDVDPNPDPDPTDAPLVRARRQR